MYWVLENNLLDDGYQNLIKYLKRAGIGYKLVKVIPNKNILVYPDFDTFSKDADESDNIEIDSPLVFPFGTMGLSLVSVAREWKPGSLFNSEFTFENWSKGFGIENLLNSTSKVLRVSDELTDFPYDDFFIRPCEDNKAFSGGTVGREEFLEWQKSIIAIDDKLSKLNKDTMILVAPLKNILQEARMFIFNGKYVTGSYYKSGDRVHYKEVLDGDPIIEYTNKVVSKYEPKKRDILDEDKNEEESNYPAKAFVIDIALTDNGYKIIEINNINSVGLYASNISRFVNAVHETFGE